MQNFGQLEIVQRPVALLDVMYMYEIRFGPKKFNNFFFFKCWVIYSNKIVSFNWF